jgi:hypothetical protein
MNKSYLVTWSMDICAASPEAAALEAHGTVSDPFNTATIFSVTDKEGRRVMVDTEGGKEAYIFKDERSLTDKERLTNLVEEINQKIELARQIAKEESVSLRLSDKTEVEFGGFDHRVRIACKGLGATMVNYREEAVSIEVVKEGGDAEIVLDTYFEMSELVPQEQPASASKWLVALYSVMQGVIASSDGVFDTEEEAKAELVEIETNMSNAGMEPEGFFVIEAVQVSPDTYLARCRTVVTIHNAHETQDS